MGKKVDLTVQIFGDYIVTGFDDTKGKYKYYWNCECIHCGSLKSIARTSLKDNKSIRCNVCNKWFGKREPRGYQKDITGEKFGEFTVDGFAFSKNTHSYWNCRCSCGNKVIKGIGYLHNGLNLMCDECIEKSNNEAIKALDNALEHKDTFVPVVVHTGKAENKYRVIDDYVVVNDNILIDLDDFEFIKKFKRYIGVNSSGYAYFKYCGQEVFIHRLVTGLPVNFDDSNPLIAEHKDGNRKNNRKSNLRICEKKINPMNCGIYSNNISGHKGISWCERLQKYQVNLQCNKINHYLGVYASYEEAVKVREAAEQQYFGEFNRSKEWLNNTGADNYETIC